MEYLQYNGNNQSEAGRVFDIQPRIISNWVRQKDHIADVTYKRRKTRVIQNIVARFPEMESQLLEWFDQQRSENKCVSS